MSVFLYNSNNERHDNASVCCSYNVIGFFYYQSIIKYSDWLLTAGLLLTVAGVITGFPVSLISAAVTVAAGALGIYYIVKDVQTEAYDVYLYNNKNVYIAGSVYYWAGKTVKYRAIVGDIGIAYDYKSTNQHWDFNDNNQLLETGLYNYFNW